MAPADGEKIEWLLRALRHGNADALDGIYALLGGRMLALARGIVRNRADAEDVVSESFLKLARGIGGYRPGTNGCAFVMRIVRNTAYDLQNGEDVLLSVHVEYVRGLTRWRADVSFDLTEGAMLPEEFIPFGELSAEGSVNGYVYRYDDRSWNGEPVTDVCLTLSAGECYLTVMGQQREEALGVFLALLTEQA